MTVLALSDETDVHRGGDEGDARPDPARHPVFLRLFARHQREVYAYIVGLVGNWTDADEVMQDTSVSLWEMFGRFREGTSFVSWACSVAHFRVLRFRQKEGRDRLRFGDEFIEAVAATAREEADDLEPRRQALEDCLTKLRPEDRDLVKSCYAGGEAIKAVAEKLARPVKGVYKAVSRIRQLLFDCVSRRVAEQR